MRFRPGHAHPTPLIHLPLKPAARAGDVVTRRGFLAILDAFQIAPGVNL
jgi:hypothetical protein